MVLLTGAGLVLRGFYGAMSRPLGFRSVGLLSASVSLPEMHYDKDKTRQFDRDLLDRVRALPDVKVAAMILNAPFGSMDWGERHPSHRHAAVPAGTGAVRAGLLCLAGLFQGDGDADPART